MKKFFVPKKGLLVRHPATFTPVPQQGELVDWNGSNGRYWRRRVRCGDGKIVEQKVTKTTQPKKKEK